MSEKFVIVGNGVAGVTAAATLASEAPGSEITLLAEEKYPYYRRPWLPDFLAGNYRAEELVAYPDSWYAQRGIRVRLETKVASIERNARTVTLVGGEKVPYGKLLLACGGNAWIPPVQNAGLRGVFTLRTLDDALTIREYAQQVGSAIVVGGGLLGLEAARGLKSLGLDVTVIEIFPYLLPRQLDAEGAAVLTGLIQEIGITVITGAVVEAVVGEEKVRGVQLKDGRFIPGGMVHFSSGIRSNTGLAAQAGLAVNRGVVADEQMRTSDPNIFVVGDMAEHKERVYGIIPAAIEQARVAGANMVRESAATYAGTVPSNTLKVMGIDLTAIGNVNPEGPEFVSHRKTHAEKKTYKKLVLANGIVVGAILLGDRKAVIPITRLINRRADVSAHGARMLEDDFDLAALLA